MSENFLNKKFKGRDPEEPIPKTPPVQKPIKNLVKFPIDVMYSKTDLRLLKKRQTRIRNTHGFWKDAFKNIKRAVSSSKTIRKTSRSLSDFYHVEALMKFTRLECVHFHYYGGFKNNEKSLVHTVSLWRCLKRFKFLKQITLEFDDHDGQRDIGLRSFSKCLKRCRILQILKFKLENCSNATGVGLEHISKGLMRLTSLQNAQFDFYYCSNITDVDLKGLSKALKRLVFLQGLGFSIVCCHQITDEGIGSLSEAMEKLSCLQRIHLAMYGNHVTSVGKEKMNETLKKHPSLKKITKNYL